MNFPQIELKPNYIGRYLAAALCLLVVFVCVFALQTVGIIILFPAMVLLGLGVFTIKFPSIKVYSTFFSVVNRGFIKSVSSSEKISFRDIKSYSYKEGFFNRGQMEKQVFLGTAGYGGFTKPDYLHLEMKDGTTRFIRLYGSKNEQRQLLQILNSRT